MARPRKNTNPINSTGTDDMTEVVQNEVELNEAVEAPEQPAVEEVVEQPKPRMFPVKLRKNYRPLDYFTIGGELPSEVEREKVKAGTEIELPVEEAKNLIAKGIADRNDAI